MRAKDRAMFRTPSFSFSLVACRQKLDSYDIAFCSRKVPCINKARCGKRSFVACASNDRNASEEIKSENSGSLFAHSRDEWNSDVSEKSAKAIPEDALAGFRAEFGSSEGPSHGQSKSATSRTPATQYSHESIRTSPPSPVTPAKFLRSALKFVIYLLNEVVMPTMYVLSLAWHDFKVRVTATRIRTGESPFFLPSPETFSRSSFTSERSDKAYANWRGGTEKRTVPGLSTEEQQIELVQDAAIRAANVVQSTAENAWNTFSDALDIFKDENDARDRK